MPPSTQHAATNPVTIAAKSTEPAIVPSIIGTSGPIYKVKSCAVKKLH